MDAILFTHGHADHILGMDDVRRFNALQSGAMPCYGDAQTLDDIRHVFGYVFDPATPKGGGLPQLELFRILGPFSLGRHEVAAGSALARHAARFSVSASAASRT